uniref:NRPD1A n=1 Tax=Arundo donax TaxID=35708 RepID=A0A0A9FLC5_ARUDO
MQLLKWNKQPKNQQGHQVHKPQHDHSTFHQLYHTRIVLFVVHKNF